MNNDKETTDTGLRYAAYANRVRTILLAAHRYVAYTSDIGESFRPVAHPYLVKSCYAISWSYILGDVAYEGWKANLKQNGQYSSQLRPWSKKSDYPEPDPLSAKMYTEKADFLDWKVLMVKRGLFQSIASMGLPAFTIHSSVRYSSYLFKNSKSHALKTYGPVGIGLAVVPLLPYLFDEPVEHAIDYAFSEGKLLLA